MNNLLRLIMLVLVFSCSEENGANKLEKGTWISADGALKLQSDNNGLFITGNSSLCIWKLVYHKNSIFKLHGVEISEKSIDFGQQFEELGLVSIQNYSDSSFFLNDFNSCIHDIEPVRLEFINLDYYSNNIKWDSIHVINYGELNNDKVQKYYRSDLLPSDRKIFDLELTLLFKSKIVLSGLRDGRGMYHTIKVYYNGEQIFNEDCTRPLHGKLPRIILNK